MRRTCGAAMVAVFILTGIGEATVRKLVASGCKVIIADVAVDKGEALAAELRGSAAFCRCDVT